MHPIQQAQINHFHNQRQQQFGVVVEALGWKNEDSQQKRFEALVQLADLSDSVVLDVGCGYGDLRSFLNERFENIGYIGVDQNADFITVAKERHGNLPETHFVNGDFSQMQFKGIDYVLASGALSYHVGETDYHFNLLDRLFEMAKKGVAFNLLDDRYFNPHPILKAHNRKKLVQYCNRWNAKLRVIEGYLKDDFTVLINKNE